MLLLPLLFSGGTQTCSGLFLWLILWHNPLAGSHRGAATPLRVSRLAGARLRGPTPVLAPRFTAVFLVVDFHIQPLLLNFLNVLACPAAAFAAVT